MAEFTCRTCRHWTESVNGPICGPCVGHGNWEPIPEPDPIPDPDPKFTCETCRHSAESIHGPNCDSCDSSEAVRGNWEPIPEPDPKFTVEAFHAEGRKDDAGKNRLDLIPPELIFAVGQVLTFGAAKYSARNWEKGMGWGRVFGALMRHLWAWWRGDKADPETGFSHLWHAGCCIAFLIAFEARGIGDDDRAQG